MRVTQINYVFISYIVLHVIIYLVSLQITVLMVIILELWINVVVPVNKLYQQISQNVIENGLDRHVVGRVQKYHQVSKVIFRSENFFSDNTRVRIFFLSRNFFPQFNIRLYDKNSESDYFFFLHQNQNIFSATLRIRIFFLEKKPCPLPPWKLNGPSLINF